MKRMWVVLGASTIALAIVSTGAEARKVYYEIDGKRYSYSTNNRAQTALARERIAAAQAAKSAKAKADEERSRHPLVSAFGSTTQREAKQAQEKLEKLLSDTPEWAQTRRTSAERWANLTDKRTNGKSDRLDRKAAPEPVSTPRESAEVPQQPSRTPMVLPPSLAEAPPPLIAEPAPPSQRGKVRSISFDVETGIKTTIMTDGAIEEEPFDSGVLAHLAPEQGQANSLATFVKKLRKVASEEMHDTIITGAIRQAR